MTDPTHHPRSILVTGGAGFIGSNYVRWALAADPELKLVNVDALTYAGHLASLDGVADDHGPRYTFIHADIRDADTMRRIFAEHEVDTVVHLAAESHVDRSIDGPIDFIDTNVRGTAILPLPVPTRPRRRPPTTWRGPGIVPTGCRSPFRTAPTTMVPTSTPKS